MLTTYKFSVPLFQNKYFFPPDFYAIMTKDVKERETVGRQTLWN